MRRSVAGIALRDGLVFVARRVSGGSMGDKWEFPGGKVEPGESDKTALEREFGEEFAVPVRVGRELSRAEFVNRNEPVQLTAYEVFLDSEDFVLIEHTEWKWTSLEELGTLDFADSDLKLVPGLRAWMRQQ